MMLRCLVILLLGSVPALAGTGLDVVSGETGTVLILDGAQFHETAAAVSGARLVVVPGTGTRLALWNETDGGGAKAPFYAIGRAGEPMGRSVRTSYTLGLRYGEFDPAAGTVEVEDFLSATESENLYLVQFETQGLEEYDRAFRFVGGEVLGFMPNHARIVRVSSGNLTRIRELPFVRWAGP